MIQNFVSKVKPLNFFLSDAKFRKNIFLSPKFIIIAQYMKN